MAKLIGQQDAWTYLVDAGTAPWAGREGVAMGRVYERLNDVLHDPWPVDAIIARGYWGDVTDPESIQKIVSDEVDAKLAA